MKVLFVSSGNSQYGISPFIRSQAESLVNNGAQVKIFGIDGKGIGGYFRNIPRLRRYLKSANYDLIHAHYGLCGIVGQLARTREKLIVSFMGDDLIGSVNSRGKYSSLSKLLVWLNEYYANHKFDFIITKSKQLREKLPDLQNQAVIPNGVDFSLFYPVEQKVARQKLGFDKKKKLIIFVSDPARSEKNFQLASTAYKLLNNDETELLPVFHRSVEELNLFYNAADVLLLTSYHEGSPNVIKEAMACNLPIVSTDVGDVQEVIGYTEGCYITSFDPLDVVQKIQFAFDFGKRTNGRENIRHLEINVIAKRVIEVYQKVLEEN